jgi:hypothetical protein
VSTDPSSNDQGKFTSGIGVLLVLLALGVIAPQATRNRKPAQESPPSLLRTSESAEIADGQTESEVLQQLRGFVAADHSTRPGNKMTLASQLAAARALTINDTRERLRDRRVDVRFLIATVADPIDSHLPLSFDLSLAAILRAIERHGYVLDSYSLPWRDELQQAGRAGSATTAARHSRRPGVVLCRKAKASESPLKIELLVLLLVGETPTAGIHKEAMLAALDLVLAWQLPVQTEQQRRSAELRVVGPSYSGSVPSLCLALEAWKTASTSVRQCLAASTPIRVSLISGSATAVDPEAFKIAGSESTGFNVCFHATVVPDSVAVREVLNHLVKDRRILAREIAILVEGNTSYGAATLKQSIQRSTSNQDPEAPDADDFSKDILYLPFPAEVGRLRSEYEKQQSSQSDSAGQQSGARTNLDIPQEPPRFAQDAVPRFSPAITPVADLTLESLLSTISRRGIRAVGLLGTDSLDLLFLAQQIRRHTPGVQLFALEGDVLFYHARHVADFDGMVLAGTYPLFVANQSWTDSLAVRRQHLQFPTNSAQGIYNATIAQLNTSEQQIPLLEYAYPFQKASEVNSGERHTIPPLWLTLVGNGGFWPVRPLCWTKHSSDEEKAYVWPAANDSSQASPRTVVPSQSIAVVDPPSSIGACLFGGGALVVFVVFAAVNYRGARNAIALRRRLRRACRWMSLDDPDLPQHPLREAREGTRRRSLLALFVALTTGQAALAYPILLFTAGLNRPPFIADAWWWCAALVAVLILAVLISVTAYLALAVVLRFCRFPASRGLCVLASAGSSVAAIAVVMHFANSASPALRASLVERVGTWSSGVTPTTPILFLAIALAAWGLGHLMRLHYLEVYPLECPFPAPVPGGPCSEQTAGIAGRIEELQRQLGRTWIWPTEWLDWAMLGLLAATSWYVLVWRWVPTAEYRWLDIFVLRLGVLLVVVLIGASQIRLKASCGLFDRLLRRLGQHAIVNCYERVPARLASKVAGQIFAAAPHPGDLELSARGLARLATLGEGGRVWPGSNMTARRIADGYAKIVEIGRLQAEDDLLLAAELNRELCALSRQDLVPRLLSAWSQRQLVSRTKEVADKQEPSAADAWQAEAEVFVAMQLTTLFRQAFKQIQTMMTTLGVMLLCLLWALNSYPFQPATMFGLLCYGLVGWVVVTVVIAVVRFNRSEVISRLGGTTPNRFTLDRSLVLPLTTYVVIPVISLIAIQVPGVGRVLFDWIGVLQRALQG